MAKKSDPVPGSDQVSRLDHQLRWIFPRDVETGQKVLVHVRGIAIVPYFPYHGDGWSFSGGQFVALEAQRVCDDEGKLIGLQVGAYHIPETLLDHPRVTAMVEENPDDNPVAIPDDSLAGKEEKQPCQEECVS